MTRPKIGFKKINTKSVRGGTRPQFARWDGKPKRFPLKGEYFISGAIPTAYISKQDMTTEYFIAVICKE